MSSKRQHTPRPARYTRRQFLAAAGGAGLALGLRGFPHIRRRKLPDVDRVIVLGIDGMDPTLLQRYIRQGRMPNSRRLIERGVFSPLRTSNPPQSPVAWSNFISGTNPGGHGIFDFIIRDPATMIPGFSTSQVEAGERFVRIGDWRVPLSPGKAKNLRRGPTFWKDLEENGVDCVVFRMPANFPPTETEARSLSGLGTPDLRGGYGIFTLYTDNVEVRSHSVSGGQIERVRPEGRTVRCVLTGPRNTFAVKGGKATVPFMVHLDPAQAAAKIVIQGREFILKQGEWSDWVVVEFPMLPHLADVSGICRFYLQRARGPFSLYVTPLNINPADPALPISTPPGYARELVRDTGYFYTQGMPEDTAALSAGVFDDDEYRAQALFVLDERTRLFHHEFDRFRRGFFFFYFSSLDLNSHAFWRTLDPGHPLYTRDLARRQGDFIPSLYTRLDGIIGDAMEGLGERDVLLTVSDHGFTSFRRQFNLNSWLLDNGYAELLNPRDREEAEFFGNTDWNGTRAYGLGINSLYLNLAGREAYGIVPPGGQEALLDELVARLTAVRDPRTGEAPIARVYRPRDVYTGPCAGDAPDLVVGYNRNYRASWDTILGKYPRDVFKDNLDPWSGDHTMDPSFLSGVMMCSRPLTDGNPGLDDMAPSLLATFGVDAPEGMTGRKVF